MKQPVRPPEDPPPILGSWNRLYTAILILHLLILIGFYLFSHHYA